MKVFLQIFTSCAISLVPVGAFASDYYPWRLRGTIVQSDAVAARTHHDWRNAPHGHGIASAKSKNNGETDEGGENEYGRDGNEPADEETAEGNGKKAEDEETGTRFSYTPYAAASVGFDTNPDELTPPDDEATLFQRYDTGMTIKYDHDGIEIEFDGQAEFIDLFEYADPRRWYYEFGVDGSIEMSEQAKFLFGAERTHDKLSTPESANNQSYIGLTREGSSVHFGIRGAIEQQLFLTGDDDFGSEDAEAFDYVKSSAQADVLFAANRMISPFVRTTISNVTFPRQDHSIADRDAHDYVLVGGVAFRPSERFRMDVGGRYNYRETDDLAIDSHSNSFIDVNLAWKPNDMAQITGAIRREIDEPDTESSIMAQVTTYELGAKWQISDKFGVELSGEHSVTEQVGLGETTREKEIEGKAYYNIHDAVRLFSAFSHLWGQDTYADAPKERYERTVVRGGIETDF